MFWTINLMGIYVLPSGFLSRSSDATSESTRLIRGMGLKMVFEGINRLYYT